MTTEQKARAYDEALERARKWYSVNTNEGYRGIFEDIFHGLKESEEDEIRKELIAFLKENLEIGRADETWDSIGLKRWIAWLEKQGEKDTFIKEELECIKGYRENAIKKLKELEQQGKQKSIDDLTPQEAMDIAIAKCFESGGVCTNPLIDCNDCLKRFGDGTTITTSQTIIKEE